jgi:hypothetical protein
MNKATESKNGRTTSLLLRTALVLGVLSIVFAGLPIHSVFALGTKAKIDAADSAGVIELAPKTADTKNPPSPDRKVDPRLERQIREWTPTGTGGGNGNGGGNGGGNGVHGSPKG